MNECGRAPAAPAAYRGGEPRQVGSAEFRSAGVGESCGTRELGRELIVTLMTLERSQASGFVHDLSDGVASVTRHRRFVVGRTVAQRQEAGEVHYASLGM